MSVSYRVHMNNISISSSHVLYRIGYICTACTTQRGRSSRIIIVLSMYSVKTADMYPYCTRSLSAFCKSARQGMYGYNLCNVSFGSVSPEARGCMITLSVYRGCSLLFDRYATFSPSLFLHLCLLLHAYLTPPFPPRFLPSTNHL